MKTFALSLCSAVLALAPVATGQSPATPPATGGGTTEKVEKAPIEKIEKQNPTSKPTSRPSKDAPAEIVKPPKTVESVTPSRTETEVVGMPDKNAEALPQNYDNPADLAAYRSAQQMLKAEKRLREMLKRGELGDIDRVLTFEELSSWTYKEGLEGMPETVKKLDDQKVMMTGFMLPIDEVEGIKEFLLVQSLWSCCYGQPPDIHGIVRVVMKGKSRVDYQFDPIKIVGDFKVDAFYEDDYCLDIYQLHADSVSVIKLK